ncbi:unnamed protein product [Ilex paraguariensis]|uniref:CLAVATA3/ESR (CLE)-related protein 9 n=1 Tax=Ilex paraguariensis TaxID=185542 RepID=A0ABC8RZR5_9AQUA
MKSYHPSSTDHHQLLVLTLFLLLVMVSSTTQFSNPTLPETSSSHRRCHHDQPLMCNTISTVSPPLMCFKLKGIRHCLPLPPPPSLDEIDPRFGVEKRLVPSGPNPLHN